MSVWFCCGTLEPVLGLNYCGYITVSVFILIMSEIFLSSVVKSLCYIQYNFNSEVV